MAIPPSHLPESSNSSLSRDLQANSIALSFNCSLTSSLPPDNYDENNGEQIAFPLYDDVGSSSWVEEPESHYTDNSRKLSSTFCGTSINVSRQYSLGPVKLANDDTTLYTQPSIHVDYLSHNWSEEDVWSSWKHIVSKRWAYSNSERLENASWRAWVKLKNNLKSSSPETLNWQKDSDVTWLYGPLQTGSDEASWMANASLYGSRRTSSSSSHKKSILKKRSLSETIFQSSLPASLLFRQDAAAVQVAQFEGRSDAPLMRAATSDHVRLPFSLRRMNSSTLPSISSSWTTLSTGEKKSVQFDEQVQQCIAVGLEEDSEDGIDRYAVNNDDLDSDSDDSCLMMKSMNSKGKLPTIFNKKTILWDRFNVDGKTIIILPTTNLNSREDI